MTYADYGDRAAAALEQDLYAGGGRWFSCDGGCGTGNQDWGDDSLTYVLYLRWSITRDPSLVPMFKELVATAPSYSTCNGPFCSGWSDVPEWDSIAAEREFEVTGDPHALDLARRAYASVRDSDVYARGACPGIRYQRPFGGGGGLKTLETDSNAIKASLLLWSATGMASYLVDAKQAYAAVRQYFLDPAVALYTVYVFDDGSTCRQLEHRFFASVNGNMIWNGIALARATGQSVYLADATQTANAVAQWLADGRGIFADLQAENDVVEPLVEAFYVRATEQQLDSARTWILGNAGAAIRNDRNPDGLYGRFFNGPAPTLPPITSWQTNGGLALAIAAAALSPMEVAPEGNDWMPEQATSRDISALPSSIEFSGSGIAIYGTLGEQCCEAGHATVSIDGQETFDHTGIWQNKSSSSMSFDDAVLFAWQWAASGPHTVTFGAPASNAKEGSPFLHVRRYVVLP